MSEHKDSHGAGHDGPLTALWVSMTGASAGDHHETPPGVDPKSQGVGHEPDKFDVRSIVYVPIAVIITLVLTYTIVEFGISALTKDATDTKHDRVNINDRFARFSSDNPKPIPSENDKDKSNPNTQIVMQPRPKPPATPRKSTPRTCCRNATLTPKPDAACSWNTAW
jgi:hypothetical protein